MVIDAKGIVVAVDWDEDGVATAFAISTFDEQEYWIESRMSSLELLALVQKTVMARGRLRTENGRMILAIDELYAVPETRPVSSP